MHSSDGDGTSYRNRALSHASEMTEPSMSEAEKQHLLNSAFESNMDDHADLTSRDQNAQSVDLDDASSNSKGDDVGEEEDYVDMFGGNNSERGESDEDNVESSDGGGESSDGARPRKRQKREQGGDVMGGDEKNANRTNSESGKAANGEDNLIELTEKQQEQLDFAKNKLSKWAARLFDPNRPRGLVEPPKVIPLNDEFLSAFGKREKEYDELAGRVVDIDKKSLDVDVSESDDEGDGSKSKESKGQKVNFSEMSNCKVKITNLSYGTSTATIARECGFIGPVVDVNLILDENRQSTGRAYVVFEDHESAIGCVEKMNEKQLEGRTLYISLAAASSKKKDDPSGKGGGISSKKDNRYWEQDISTKCNRCGEVGHNERNCTNEEKPRPCALCAEVGHEMWTCPKKSICFNCGVPGHVSRECRRPRGIPKRCVCTICYSSGHHRWQCRERQWVPEEAICMQCGKPGHFMCSDMKWFFGLQGVSCFQCGCNLHHGSECQRPSLDQCARNAEIGAQEIEMAEAESLREQLNAQRSNRESRDRRHRDYNDRPRSMPPPRSRENRRFTDDDEYGRQRGSNSSRDSRWR